MKAFAFLSILLLLPFIVYADAELLVNGGFETGSLDPWYTDNWTISTSNPHSGTYCVYDMYNHYIRQDFSPIDVSLVVSITFWYRQPTPFIFAFDLFYGASDYDENIYYPSTGDWISYDITSYLRSSGNLTGLRLWGYSGGGDQTTYLDDASILIDNTSVQSTSLGNIKALFN
jgi:hypothetical protein